MFLSLRLRVSLSVAACLFTVAAARAEKLSITSTPTGATVEINGATLGTTPFEKEYPGGYFHRTRTSFGARLERPLVARISLAGYATKEIVLTEGPMEWIGLDGSHHGEYWLFKSNHLEVALDSIAATFTGNVNARLTSGSAHLAPELSPESLAAQAKSAVVQLKGLRKLGTGFFVTETGVIATNAHVARDEGSLLVLLANGQQLEGKVAYIDSGRDIALVKVPGENFPHLTLAAADTVQQGESVLAIGNPGGGMEFSMTKGIVSAVGRFPSAGSGTWVQTDATINPGNSGGPLINMKGEVVGMNTLKVAGPNTSGIGFALSASDVLEVLRRFYPATVPESAPVAEEMSATNEKGAVAAKRNAADAPAKGSVNIVGTEGAEIFVDDRAVGDVPSAIVLSEGRHTIRIAKPGHADKVRTIDLQAGSSVTIHADFTSSATPQ